MSTASSGSVAMIRPLTRTVLKNSGRSAGWVRMCRQPSSRSPARSRGLAGAPGAARAPPIARMPSGREQVADRVGHHGRHRAEQPDRGAAQRRPERGGGPGRGLEPGVGDEQVLRPAQRLEVGAAGRVEGDVGRGDDDRDDQELGEAEPAERERGRDRQQRREPGQVHRDHHRPLAAELHPRAERHRDQPRPPPGPTAASADTSAGPACSTRIAISGNAPNASPEP